MKLRFQLPLSFALLLLCAVSASAGVDSRIVGKVVDSDGNPVEGAVITVVASDFDYRVATETNKKGKFTLTILDATRTLAIQIEKAGYQTIQEPIDPPVGDIMRQEWTLGPAGQAGPSSEEMAQLDARNKVARTYNEGAELFNQGQLDQAIVKMEEALALDPDLAVAHLAKARAHLTLAREAGESGGAEQYEAALVSARRLEELVPEEPFGLEFMFDSLWGLGRQEEAETVLAELAEKDPGRQAAERYFRIGVDAIKAQQLDRAVTAFTRSSELAPELKEAYLNLALVAAAQGRQQDVLGYVDRYLELDPGNSRALGMRYEAHTALGNQAEADAAFAQLKATDPAQVAETFFKAGIEQWNAGQSAAACENFRRVLEVAPDHPRGHFQLGLCYVASDSTEARRLLERFIELAPDDPETATAQAMLSSLG